MRAVMGVCLFSLLPATGWAGACDDNFSKQGNAFTGSSYRSSVALADLTVASAIEQMRSLAVSKSMSVLSADAENGSLLIEEPETMAHKPIPMIVSAVNENGVTTVAMEVKLGRGALAKVDDMKREICAMLTQVQSGAASEAAAQRNAAAAGSAEPERIDAYVFSRQIARQANENQSTINPRYKDKRFTITGRAAFIMEDGDDYNVGYDIPDQSEVLLRGPSEPAFDVGVSCMMAKSQTAYALTLREGDRIELTGTFHRYDQFKHVVWLEGCVQAR